MQTMEEVRARHKKELKTLDGSCRKLLKQANKNKAKIAEAEKKNIKVTRFPPRITIHCLYRNV